MSVNLAGAADIALFVNVDGDGPVFSCVKNLYPVFQRVYSSVLVIASAATAYNNIRTKLLEKIGI